MLAFQRNDEMNDLEGSCVGISYREIDGPRFLCVVFGNGGGEETMSG